MTRRRKLEQHTHDADQTCESPCPHAPAPAKPARAVMVAEAMKVVAANPPFTVDELRIAHRALMRDYPGEYLYDARRSIIRKLDVFFGDDTEHLKRSDK